MGLGEDRERGAVDAVVAEDLRTKKKKIQNKQVVFREGNDGGKRRDRVFFKKTLVFFHLGVTGVGEQVAHSS